MTDRIRKALGDLKARQAAGEHMPCPRCGRDTMKENIHTNALSRHADIYICDACGTAEALLKFMSNPLPVTEWAYLRPVQRPSAAASAEVSTAGRWPGWEHPMPRPSGFAAPIHIAARHTAHPSRFPKRY